MANLSNGQQQMRTRHDSDGRRSINDDQPPISRTPSDDRQLLRSLVDTPDDQDPYPDKAYEPSPYPQSKQNTQQNQSKHARRSNQEAPNRIATRPVTQNRTLSAENVTPESQYGDQNGSQLSRARSQVSQKSSQSIFSTTRVESSQTSEDTWWQSDKSVTECNLYMLTFQIECDVTFLVGDAQEHIKAHKYVLISRSPEYFRKFTKQERSQNISMKVPDIQPKIFREVLKYLYTDEIEVTDDNITPMLYASKKLALKGVAAKCFKFLDSKMYSENVCKIMEQAHMYEENNMYEKCLRFIYANGSEVLKSSSFPELCSTCVEKVIDSDALRADEIEVFEAMMTWASRECARKNLQPNDKNRREALGNLLFLIRFPVIDVNYFTQNISLGSLMTKDESLSIFQYHHGEEQRLTNRFKKRSRDKTIKPIAENLVPDMLSSTRSAPTSKAIRFRTVDGSWKLKGIPDAICFTVSKPIILHGAEIYGSTEGPESFLVNVKIFDDTKQEAMTCDVNIYTTPGQQKYDILLPRPMRIPPFRVFTIQIIIKGATSWRGVDGMIDVVSNGVSFQFMNSNRSSNGTDITVGQIPGILFSNTQ
ncbi:hypothetical protein ACJMK2_027693 [Sinanodonta woodiana]|uniref:BTB domain-containing protein n=1 Tax=Sinanodonta woodiana TaxID=1069815 RepID=A0ABD3X4Q4_SINWO